MDLESITKTAKNISDVAPQAYEDALQPTAQNMGKALGTISGLLNTALTPIEILNKTVSIKKEKFLQEYSDRLNKIPLEKQCEPNLATAGPIIEHLKYKITEDTLRQKYVNLLSAASNSDDLCKPLMAYDNVLSQLTPYEIRLMTELFGNILGQVYAMASITTTTKNGYHFIYKNVADISFNNFSFDIITVMISNCERLGILYIDNNQHIEPNEKYNYIYNSSLYQTVKEECDKLRKKTGLPYPMCQVQKQAFYLTEFGKSFMSTVIV